MDNKLSCLEKENQSLKRILSFRLPIYYKMIGLFSFFFFFHLNHCEQAFFRI